MVVILQLLVSEKSKGVVYTGAGLWFGLVIITAAFNSFII